MESTPGVIPRDRSLEMKSASNTSTAAVSSERSQIFSVDSLQAFAILRWVLYNESNLQHCSLPLRAPLAMTAISELRRRQPEI